MRQHTWDPREPDVYGHRQVVPHQVQLGVAGPGEEGLVRVGDGHLPAADVEDLLAGRHGGQSRPRISDTRNGRSAPRAYPPATTGSWSARSSPGADAESRSTRPQGRV